jgi:hypothetical protein
MTSGRDIADLYQEFTEALTEVLAENPLARHAMVGSLGLALPPRSIPSIPNMSIFWLSVPKTPSTGLARQQGQRA